MQSAQSQCKIIMNMTSSASSVNNIQSWYNLDGLKFKNKKYMKCKKRAAVKISKT
jgi:hypothetical protein